MFGLNVYTNCLCKHLKNVFLFSQIDNCIWDYPHYPYLFLTCRIALITSHSPVEIPPNLIDLFLRSQLLINSLSAMSSSPPVSDSNLSPLTLLQMLGYCVPQKLYNGDADSLVAMVTELGETIDIIKLLQMSWEDRLRVSGERHRLAVMIMAYRRERWFLYIAK